MCHATEPAPPRALRTTSACRRSSKKLSAVDSAARAEPRGDLVDSYISFAQRLAKDLGPIAGFDVLDHRYFERRIPVDAATRHRFVRGRVLVVHEHASTDAVRAYWADRAAKLDYGDQMPLRMSWSWIGVGGLAVIGGYWLSLLGMRAMGGEGAWFPYAGHLITSMLAGAVMVTHAALRPWREPVVASVVAIGLLAILFFVLPEPSFSWVAARSEFPWLTILGLAGLSAVGAMSGAAIARRFTSTAPNTATLLALSALVIMGVFVTFTQVVLGIGLAREIGRWTILVFLVGVPLGGFLTQRMVSVYRPRTSGGGAALFVLFQISEGGSVVAIGSAVVGALLLIGLGALGARLAKRWVVPQLTESPPSIPPARLR